MTCAFWACEEEAEPGEAMCWLCEYAGCIAPRPPREPEVAYCGQRTEEEQGVE